MIKKLIMILLITIGLLFSACGGGGGSNSDTQSTSDADDQDADDQDADNQDADNQDADDEIISHTDSQGNIFTYNVIVSSVTGLKWFDRNLGAIRPCKDINESNASYGADLNDSKCFGDYFQWGRRSDGHEKEINTNYTPNKEVDLSNTSSSYFKTIPEYALEKEQDWYDKDLSGWERHLQWGSIEGKGVCPEGFRVPTLDELLNELNGFENKDLIMNELKIPFAGYRSSNGNMALVNKEGRLHSTNQIGGKFYGNSTKTSMLYLGDNIPSKRGVYRYFGAPVRCVGSNSKPEAFIDINDSTPIKIDDNITIELSGVRSRDINPGDTKKLKYTWSLKYPKDTVEKIENDTSSIATFTPTVESGYVITLTVKDPDEAKDTKSVTIYKGWQDFIKGDDGIDYKKIISPHTGRVWLDRNLGAGDKCEDVNNSDFVKKTGLYDKACFGDYYQWGRGRDGHEKIDINVATEQTIYENNPEFIPLDLEDIGSKFIPLIDVEDLQDYDKTGSMRFHPSLDWTVTSDLNGSIRVANWNKTDGSFCPKGFRVPTLEELKAETVNTIDGMNEEQAIKDNFLKLPYAGKKNFLGVFNYMKLGYYWSTNRTYGDYYSYALSFPKPLDYRKTRFLGLPIRCIKPVDSN